MEILRSIILANIGNKRTYDQISKQATPYPAKDLGSQAYYLFRHNDFVLRYPGRQPPDYYLEYGDKYLRRFKGVTYPLLSDEGKRFIQTVARALQHEIENKLIYDPKGFSDLEANSVLFTEFAYNTHPKAYCESGWAKLPKSDRDKIIIDVDRSDYILSAIGRKTGYDLAEMCGSYWNALPTYQNLPSFR